MKKLLIVESSVRDGRNADKILELVQNELRGYPDFEATVADFKAMPLPFFDAAQTPSTEGFAPTDENVKQWASMVAAADAVLILTAEYNHSYTPVLKNAIDWLYKEWHDKPVGFIGYGWVGAARAIKHLRDVFASNINARALESEANLRFMKEIGTDGSAIDTGAVSAAIKSVLDELEAKIPETPQHQSRRAVPAR